MKKGQAAVGVLIALLVIIALVIIFLLLYKGNLITARVVDNTQTCTQTRIPFETTESYVVNVPYTERQCTTQDYDADARYTDGDSSSWSRRQNLYDSDGDPITNKTRRYSITNYEDEDGRFGIIVNYFDSSNREIDSFVYERITVQEDDTEEGTISYRRIYDNSPSRARSFNLELEVDELQQCNSVTKYRDEVRQRKVISYRTETICD